MSQRRNAHFFYGWVIVGVTFFTQSVFAGIGATGFGTFILPLQQQFGWTKSALTGARAVMQTQSGLMGPVEGFMIDRFGPKVVIILGSFIFGLGMMLLAMVHELWQYYAAFMLVTLGTSIGGFLVAMACVQQWFVRKRTLALSISHMGFGFGGMVMVPVLVWAHATFGWRGAAVTAGLTAWAIGIPLAFLMRSSPEKYGMLPDGDTPGMTAAPRARSEKGPAGPEVDFTLGEALRTRAFWLVGLGHSLAVMLFSTLMVHQIPHMEEGMGLSSGAAAAVATLHSGMSIPSLLLGGFLGDRVDKRLLASVGIIVASASAVLFILGTSLIWAVLFALGSGLAFGLRTGPMINSLRGDYFGRKHFGKIAGMSSLIMIPSGIIGPMFAAVMADALGSYRLAFLLLALTSALGAVCFTAARKPASPHRRRTPVELTQQGPRASPAKGA